MKTLLLLLAAACGGSANMFDVDEPSKLPGARCSNGCAAWADSNATIQGDNCHGFFFFLLHVHFNRVIKNVGGCRSLTRLTFTAAAGWFGDKDNAAAFGKHCAQLAFAPGLSKPTGQVRHPPKPTQGVTVCYPCMLTCANPMTSSHFSGPLGTLIPPLLAEPVRGASASLVAACWKDIGITALLTCT